MKLKKKRTINDLFNVFKRYCDLFLVYFGLKEYEIFYCLTPLDKSRAQIDANYVGKNCIISLDKNYLDQWYIEKMIDSKLDEEIKCVAFHEILELLLYQHWNLLDKFYSENIIQEANHRVIGVLENTLFNEIKDKIK